MSSGAGSSSTSLSRCSTQRPGNTAFGIYGAHQTDALVAAHRNGGDGAVGKRARELRQRESTISGTSAFFTSSPSRRGSRDVTSSRSGSRFTSSTSIVSNLSFTHSLQIYNVAKVTIFSHIYFIFDRMLITLCRSNNEVKQFHPYANRRQILAAGDRVEMVRLLDRKTLFHSEPDQRELYDRVRPQRNGHTWVTCS